MKRKVAYVVGPFRPHNNEHGYNFYEQRKNIETARDVALRVWQQPGWCAICPHMNTADFQGAAPDEVWLDGDIAILELCRAVIVCPHWRDSIGSRDEISRAKELGIPVFTNPEALRFYDAAIGGMADELTAQGVMV